MDWTQLGISVISALGGGGIGAKLIDLKRERQQAERSAEETARGYLAERLAKLEERCSGLQDRLDKTEEALSSARMELVKAELRIQLLEQERDSYRAGYDRIKAELEQERAKQRDVTP